MNDLRTTTTTTTTGDNAGAGETATTTMPQRFRNLIHAMQAVLTPMVTGGAITPDHVKTFFGLMNVELTTKSLPDRIGARAAVAHLAGELVGQDHPMYHFLRISYACLLLTTERAEDGLRAMYESMVRLEALRIAEVGEGAALITYLSAWAKRLCARAGDATRTKLAMFDESMEMFALSQVIPAGDAAKIEDIITRHERSELLVSLCQDDPTVVDEALSATMSIVDEIEELGLLRVDGSGDSRKDVVRAYCSVVGLHCRLLLSRDKNRAAALLERGVAATADTIARPLSWFELRFTLLFVNEMMKTLQVAHGALVDVVEPYYRALHGDAHESIVDCCRIREKIKALSMPRCARDGCGKLEGLRLCGRCKGVLYCSNDCQATDWQTHKIACSGDDTSSGVAKKKKKRKTKKGKLAAEDNRANGDVSKGFEMASCTRDGCEKRETSDIKFRCCGRCLMAKYCGKECQTVDWKRHKKFCVAPATSLYPE